MRLFSIFCWLNEIFLRVKKKWISHEEQWDSYTSSDSLKENFLQVHILNNGCYCQSFEAIKPIARDLELLPMSIVYLEDFVTFILKGSDGLFKQFAPGKLLKFLKTLFNQTS